jgi:hypothetical protein
MILEYTTRNERTTYHLRVDDREGDLYARMKVTVREVQAVLAVHNGSTLEVLLGGVRTSDLLARTNAALRATGEWRTLLAVHHTRSGIICDRRQPGTLTVGVVGDVLAHLPLLDETTVTLADRS